MLDTLRITHGSLRDYAALSQHHYRARRPATATRILTLRRDQPTVIGRWLKRRNETQTVGVLVESMPALNCRLRDEALHDRYAQFKDARQRAALLNAEMRCISRVIIHPQWRGLGLAVRLVRAALTEPTSLYTEALAAMGAVHPFFEKSGMTPYRRPPHTHDQRLAAALMHVGLALENLAVLHQTVRHIEQLPLAQRQWLQRELSQWHRRTRGRRDATLRDQLTRARRNLLCQPVYYLYEKQENKKAGNGTAHER